MLFVQLKAGLWVNPNNVKYVYQPYSGAPVEVHFANDTDGLSLTDTTVDEVLEKLSGFKTRRPGE